MSENLSRLLVGFDGCRLSRRQLIQGGGALALALASGVDAAVSQPLKSGWIGAPPQPPFEPTGWKTVLLDHLSCRVEDHEREAAFYNALMNWGVRRDNSEEAILDVGDWGSIIVRGGYRPSASEPQPRNVIFDQVCWGIDPWDARTVEAALKARGLNPVADNREGGFEGFHVKDPDGFDVQISNGNRHNRRAIPAQGNLSVAAPFAHTDWKTIWLDHISYQCSDYRRTTAFYEALLGWQPWLDSGHSNQVRIGDVGDTIIRNHAGGRRGVLIDHISFGIAAFNPEAVKSALEMRRLQAEEDTGNSETIDASPYKSYHTRTPSGFDLQVSNADSVNRIDNGESGI